MASQPPAVPESFRTEQADEPGSRRWLIVLGAVLVIIVIGATIIAIKRRTTAEDISWPHSFDGRAAGLGADHDPATQVKVTAKPGVYVWSGFDGLHLWVVNGSGVAGVKGSMTGMANGASASLAVRGSGSVSVVGDTMTFDLPASPTLVGVDFSPGFFGKKLTFTLTGANGPVPLSLIFVGAHSHAKALPLVISKVATKLAPTS